MQIGQEVAEIRYICLCISKTAAARDYAILQFRWFVWKFISAPFWGSSLGIIGEEWFNDDSQWTRPQFCFFTSVLLFVKIDQELLKTVWVQTDRQTDKQTDTCTRRCTHAKTVSSSVPRHAIAMGQIKQVYNQACNPRYWDKIITFHDLIMSTRQLTSRI